MIIRRKNWLYRTHTSDLAKRISFPKPVTRQEVEAYVLREFKKIVVEIWSK